MQTRQFSPLARASLCALLLLTLHLEILAISFDPNFGSAGKFVSLFGEGDEPSSFAGQVLLQASGRIVLVGSHSQGIGTRRVGIGLVGLTGAGALDQSFGTGGRTLIWSASNSRMPTNSLLLGDGSILVNYQFWESVSNNRPGIARFSPDGTLDPTFDPDINLVPNATTPVRIAEGPGGKIYAQVRNLSQHYLVRLNADGSRDATYADNGVRSLSLLRFGNPLNSDPRIFSLQPLPDGKILIAGSYHGQNQALLEGPLFVIRLDSDGHLDRTWGMQGVVRLTVPNGNAGGYVLRIQPDGKVLIGGSWTFLGSTTYLARLTRRGRLDNGFGQGGVVMAAFGDVNSITGITVLPDGRLLAVGGTGSKTVPSNQRLFLLIYSATGVLESQLITTYVVGQESAGTDVVRRPDGRFIACGYVQNATNFRAQFAVGRFQQ